jgi:alpha-tubulin suppressor-like RCC1 family protein
VYLYASYSAFDHFHSPIFPVAHNIIQISCTLKHILLLREDGKVYAFGKNRHYQLGLGDTKIRRFPEIISNLNDIVSVSAGPSSSIALDSSGNIYTWGYNRAEECLININRDTPVLTNNLYCKLSCSQI